MDLIFHSHSKGIFIWVQIISFWGTNYFFQYFLPMVQNNLTAVKIINSEYGQP